MSLKIKYPTCASIFILFLLFVTGAAAQDSTARLDKNKPDVSDKPSTTKTDSDANLPETENIDKYQKYRLLQSNDFLVDTAYLQEEGELQHTFTFSRTNHHNWSMTFNEELPLGSEKHQLSITLPAQLVGNGTEKYKGLGDLQIEYGYSIYGDSASRVTISPGIGVSLPTGNARKELGAGSTGVSFKLPVSVMLTKRFASNSTFETTFTKSARNDENERADTFGYEFGQSFVWFAKPKLNFLVEAVWERSQEVIGQNLKEYEREFLVSPGVRWAHVFKSGLIVSPGVAFPVGIGPSRGEKGIFFYISFEHSFKKER